MYLRKFVNKKFQKSLNLVSLLWHESMKDGKWFSKEKELDANKL